jgi:SAM-dependent methyltransferase
VTNDQGLPGDPLLLAMWLATVAELEPTALLKDLELYRPRRLGVRPPRPEGTGPGVRFSRSFPLPVLTTDPRNPPNPHVEAFERFIRPLAVPIFGEALQVMRGYLRRASRILDVYCGAGETSRKLAPLVPDGEVVAIEPEAALLVEGFQETRAMGIGNVAFFQVEPDALPLEFEGAFDVIFLPLSLHRYPDLSLAATELFRVCRSEAFVFIVEASPAWYRRARRVLGALGEGALEASDGASDRIPRPRAVESRFRAAGFAHYSWEELLPGVGLAVLMK